MGKLRYTENMLSNIMGLENQWIHKESIDTACKLTLDKEMEDYKKTKIKKRPNYTIWFRRKLREIGIKKNMETKSKFIAERVAIFILICLLSFSTFLAVNSEARERVAVLAGGKTKRNPSPIPLGISQTTNYWYSHRWQDWHGNTPVYKWKESTSWS